MSETGLLFPSLILYNEVALATAVLFCYDWLLTLPQEVSQIWMQTLKSSSGLYLVARYFSLGYWVILTIFFWIPSDSLSCSALYYIASAIVILCFISLIATSVLRTWAVYQRSAFILLVTSLAGIVPIISNLSWLWAVSPVYVPATNSLVGGCNLILREPFFKWFPVSIYGSLSMSATIFLLTFLRTFKASRAAKAAGIQTSIYSQLLRDGSLYFVIVSIFNASGAVIYEYSSGKWVWFSIVAITAPYPLLTCKLILNLRRTAHAQDRGSKESTGRAKSTQEISFASSAFLDNLGAPLRSVLGDDDDENGVVRTVEDDSPSTEMQRFDA